jgi:hypothetical protein
MLDKLRLASARRYVGPMPNGVFAQCACKHHAQQ